MVNTQSDTHRQRLVALLRATGAIRTSSVAAAFQAVPRELFVARFYEREGRGWSMREQGDLEDHWLENLYQNAALITAINQYSLPVSSSSQPSIMASMIEELRVEPGQRVLEIGTGTGYNAALLAALTHDPSLVTTIEVDAYLSARAAATLREHVGPVQTVTGDGRLDLPEHHVYDRMIATASSSYLPHSWYRHLAPGGRLVMPLEGSLQMSGFLVLEKEDESARGSFRAVPLHFMALHAASEEVLPYPALPADVLTQPPTETVEANANDPVLLALRDRGFKWYLQWAWPPEGNVRITVMRSPEGKEVVRIDDRSSSPSRLSLHQLADGSWSGKVHGSFPLWTTIQQRFQQYLDAGQPGQDRFHVVITRSKASLIVDSAEELRDLFGAR